MLSLLPIPLETLSVFAAASLALALAPGPDNIFVLAQSALHGRLAGLFVTMGLCIGLLFHTTAVALGVATLFATSALAFNLLKILGAAYLLYLAWQAFQARVTPVPEGEGPKTSYGRLYARGVIMNITNPKVAIFFLAFLPQFATHSEGSLTLQLLFLGAVFILATLVMFGSIAWFSGFLGERLRSSSRAQIILNRIAGLAFTGLALRLVTAER